MADKLTPTEVLSRVKQYFTELMAPVPPVHAPAPVAAAEPTEHELKDGGKVTIDKLEVGGIVMIDGGPALPGDLELADGTKLTIGENGVISALVPGESAASAAPDPTVEMSTKFASFETATNEKFAQYETKFSAYEQRFADYEVKMKKANKVIEELLNLSQLIVEAPAAAPDPAVRGGAGFSKDEKAYTPALFS